MSRRMSFDASSSAMARGDVGLHVDRELAVVPPQLRRPEAADHLGDVVDRGPARRWTTGR